MCTSLTYATRDGFHFLARTMDFAFVLEGTPHVHPRRFGWRSQSGEEHRGRYGFVGAGRELEQFFFADGVNEKGLAVCELYFPDEASYAPELVAGKVNLAPHELVTWLLSEIGSVQELRARFEALALVSYEFKLLGTVLPLHFIVSDSTGACVVIEPTADGLKLKENPAGVMTNSPELEWHLKNLNNLLGLRPENPPETPLGTLTLKPFGQGAGTLGLPGGYTPPERFLRTAFLREYTERPAGAEAGVAAILGILNPVTIPKGVNLKPGGVPDYTQYRSVMSLSERAYYFNNYGTNEVLRVVLTEMLLESKTPQAFPAKKEMVFTHPS
ncbi:choloylglycine hydrolase family protein [Ruficoccus sp. ZRK36]|uniref:choloylglycine hydrolase family protein n=1 Tax=Ruficoccus sp. ZRK36 TaxID=2866311 RepID=UPI001C72F221|nr:choloylglycine hydrolase family protein [Ruficoccus sp. ZRK36]QYY35624.1 choloylglycine hydrolase family protein [Ruficoccus sp. ZRK36]